MTLAVRPRSLVPLGRLHQVARDRAATHDEPDWFLPLDNTLPFICPTLTPLYYTPSYALLTSSQALRYNQLVAMSFNEVISFFEETLAGTVLTNLARHPKSSPDLRASLADFHAEEASHTALFRRLNLLGAPHWYNQRHDFILRFPPAARRAIEFVGRNASRFPFILWVMLAMEERSLEISRRYAALPDGRIEPHFAAIYRNHMQDESRHVQIDWHLIEQFYAQLSRPARAFNARLFARTVRRYLLGPRTAGRRVIDVLIGEFPNLARHRPRFLNELGSLEKNPAYQLPFFSPAATPITFRLMDRFPEFRMMSRILTHYDPGQTVREESP